jgi:hypothetical protein
LAKAKGTNARWVSSHHRAQAGEPNALSVLFSLPAQPKEQVAYCARNRGYDRQGDADYVPIGSVGHDGEAWGKRWRGLTVKDAILSHILNP